MFEITMMNLKTKEIFTKNYASYYLFQKALNKIKRSKKLTIIGYGGI